MFLPIKRTSEDVVPQKCADILTKWGCILILICPVLTKILAVLFCFAYVWPDLTGCVSKFCKWKSLAFVETCHGITFVYMQSGRSSKPILQHRRTNVVLSNTSIEISVQTRTYRPHAWVEFFGLLVKVPTIGQTVYINQPSVKELLTAAVWLCLTSFIFFHRNCNCC